MRVLILDDEKVRHEKISQLLLNKGASIRHTYTEQEAKNCLEERVWDLVLLDHDLLLNETPDCSGFGVVDHIVTMVPTTRPKAVIVHSMNTAAALLMEKVLKRVVPDTYRFPYGPTLFTALRNMRGQ